MLNGRLSWCLVCANFNAILFPSSIGESHEAVLLTAGLGRMRGPKSRHDAQNSAKMRKYRQAVQDAGDELHRGHGVATTGSGGWAKEKGGMSTRCMTTSCKCMITMSRCKYVTMQLMSEPVGGGSIESHARTAGQNDVNQSLMHQG